MPRRRCSSEHEYVYHVLNRAAKSSVLFGTSQDYRVFETILTEAIALIGIRVLAYCIMPNHWHFVLWPTSSTHLARFMHWLTLTHSHRWQKFHEVVGTGAVYQGRYKALPIQTDTHFLTVCRYVERNALRAGLVKDAQDWPWSSLWRRAHGSQEWLHPWPVGRPTDWLAIVNGRESEPELGQIRSAITRGAPLGSSEWCIKTAEELGIESSLRTPGRPKKDPGTVSVIAPPASPRKTRSLWDE